MTNNEILQADLLDILFEHRNKAYGAYALRRNYNYRLQWALGISVSLVVLLSLTKNDKAESANGMYTRPDVTLQTIDIPKSKPNVVEPPQKKKLPTAQVKNTPITITPDDLVKKPEVPLVSDLQDALTSTVNKSGVPFNGTVEGRGNSDPAQNSVEKATGNETDFHAKSSDAQFPGGVEAFRRFLMKYLVTPEELQIGEKKTVLIRFKVDAGGAISDPQIMQSGGDEYDKEVLRVLSKMPRWIPATQNGVKVATWFTQPVTFIGVE